MTEAEKLEAVRKLLYNADAPIQEANELLEGLQEDLWDFSYEGVGGADLLTSIIMEIRKKLTELEKHRERLFFEIKNGEWDED